jgi:hypothetical protein
VGGGAVQRHTVDGNASRWALCRARRAKSAGRRCPGVLQNAALGVGGRRLARFEPQATQQQFESLVAPQYIQPGIDSTPVGQPERVIAIGLFQPSEGFVRLTERKAHQCDAVVLDVPSGRCVL